MWGAWGAAIPGCILRGTLRACPQSRLGGSAGAVPRVIWPNILPSLSQQLPPPACCVTGCLPEGTVPLAIREAFCAVRQHRPARGRPPLHKRTCSWPLIVKGVSLWAPEAWRQGVGVVGEDGLQAVCAQGALLRGCGLAHVWNLGSQDGDLGGGLFWENSHLWAHLSDREAF